ncbi:hypothetical protein ACFC18_36950 [Streptomyces sp. NPDC056121]|uniref:hypothetical protein n=1 Tax=Streptomyces sp. NPDC056121 TaxID=3345718 RepID=UPI0035E20BFE
MLQRAGADASAWTPTHRKLTSSGSSKRSERCRAKQRAFIDAGRWDKAMKMDIDEIPKP